MHYLGPKRLELVYELPLAEVLYDFYDRFKSMTQGYGSFDYEIIDYREGKLALLDILVNGEKVDALSQIVFRDSARARALQFCERLKEEIPRQMFKIAIQGAIGGEIIARTTISAFRKDVLAKCYGGDITRKRKLLEKQKRGQKTDEDGGIGLDPPERLFIRVAVGHADKVASITMNATSRPLYPYPLLPEQMSVLRLLLRHCPGQAPCLFGGPLRGDGALSRRRSLPLTRSISAAAPRRSLPRNSWQAILDRVRENFPLLPDTEITLETNPADLDDASLAAIRGMGVNRLTIGCQSFDQTLLAFLGRRHSASAGRQCHRGRPLRGLCQYRGRPDLWDTRAGDRGVGGQRCERCARLRPGASVVLPAHGGAGDPARDPAIDRGHSRLPDEDLQHEFFMQDGGNAGRCRLCATMRSRISPGAWPSPRGTIKNIGIIPPISAWDPSAHSFAAEPPVVELSLR